MEQQMIGMFVLYFIQAVGLLLIIYGGNKLFPFKGRIFINLSVLFIFVLGCNNLKMMHNHKQNIAELNKIDKSKDTCLTNTGETRKSIYPALAS